MITGFDFASENITARVGPASSKYGSCIYTTPQYEIEAKEQVNIELHNQIKSSKAYYHNALVIEVGYLCGVQTIKSFELFPHAESING